MEAGERHARISREISARLAPRDTGAREGARRAGAQPPRASRPPAAAPPAAHLGQHQTNKTTVHISVQAPGPDRAARKCKALP